MLLQWPLASATPVEINGQRCIVFSWYRWRYNWRVVYIYIYSLSVLHWPDHNHRLSSPDPVALQNYVAQHLHHDVV